MMNLLEGLCPYRRKAGVYTEFIVIRALQSEQLALRTPGIGAFQKGLRDVSGEGGLELTFPHTDIWEGTHTAQTDCRAMQQHAGFAPPVLEGAVTKEHVGRVRLESHLLRTHCYPTP